MAGRIITVRHGKPALSRGVLISARGYGDWWSKYDESGLFPGQTPPPALMERAKSVAKAFSSPMPRAKETAQALVGERLKIVEKPLFQEAPLPPPPWRGVRLSPRFWGIVSRTYWEMGFTGTKDRAPVEHKRETWKRVEQIIAFLTGEAETGDVLLCAHGYINWMISRKMADHGWILHQHNIGNKYWSWREYAREPVPALPPPA